ncbi:MFS transporter [Chromohalobacter sarecensis]|uniref:MFS transporter n=1 Tax=Chromohalobacter sarecensis TaxID=245294 RepID=A0ABV9D3X3_9GAMM|nr:MFS transporter [Chromohalobacter sarecensis]MCK0714052.1 MFS transporter [Chromohalobacter sarecensis]
MNPMSRTQKARRGSRSAKEACHDDQLPQGECDRPISSPAQTPRRGLVFMMAMATGLAVASQYYNQPLLGLIARDLDVDSGVSLVATATQIGYAIGLILLVPLGDRLNRRWLILIQSIGLTLAMLAMAITQSLAGLALVSIAVGVFATIAQQIIPFAAELASPSSRERVLSIITSGLLVGVLLSRTISGVVGETFGWRAMFVLGAIMTAGMTVVLAARLPSSVPETRESYGQLLLSLLHSLRTSPTLRRATVIQSLLFFGFSAFWTILALFLQTPKFHLGASVAGAYGILALVGVPLAPYGIRIFGRHHLGNAVRAGALLITTSFFVMAFVANLAGLAVGVVLMITGLQIALIANQTLVFNAAGSARGRFNTVFMAGQFTLGAVGSAAASWAWSVGGWPAVMALAAICAVMALIYQWIAPIDPRD